MSDPSSKPQVLISGGLTLTREREEAMILFATQRLTQLRGLMGYQSSSTYKAESWLWKRHIGTRMFENDFQWRVRDGNLFSKVNMSLNIVEQFITHHWARMCDDLIPDDEFFGVNAEGPEDENPAFDALQRWLHHRGRRQKLADKMKSGLLGALIRGEQVYKAVQTTKTIKTPVMERIVIQDGAPIRTTTGDFIFESDPWDVMQDDPSRKALRKDPTRRLPAAGQPAFSAKPQRRHKITQERGADFEWMHYADFIAPLNVKCLDDAELVGHVFEKSVFDLFDLLPEDAMSVECKKEYLTKRRDLLPEKATSEAAKPKEWAGEQEEHTYDPDASAFKTARYAEICFRWAPHATGRYERIFLLVDLDLNWPIAYDYVHSVFDWTDRPHPYGTLRIFPSEDRWYGQGYYQRFFDDSLFVDKCWNRIELELQKSGNLLYENPQATEEGMAGLPIRFRTTETRRLRGDYTGEDALKVFTVTPQVQEVQASMDTTLQRLQASVGMTTANDPALQNMAAADTLGGMEMLQETSNVNLRKREDEVLTGLNCAVRSWSEADLKNTPVDALTKLVGPEEAALVIAWLEMHLKEDLANHIAVKVETLRKSKLLQENTQVMQVMTQWIQTPPAYKEAMRPEFAHRLGLLGVKDPERLLINPEAALMAAGADPATAAAAVAGQPSPEPPAAPSA
jgi:hypothetical protein